MDNPTDIRPRTEDAVRHLLAGLAERGITTVYNPDERIHVLIDEAITLTESPRSSSGERALLNAAIALHRGRGLDILDTLAMLDRGNRALVMQALEMWNRATR